ncbi:peptidylprolyl isomerase [Paucidesulfovibrio longus]|uniref:peptidylprolyl isomerase n=1 Tax=Paucidesulfovibrio longus TaxID=889 RepID=UPI0003B4C877|nr:peptidylprolyl isomerase [Paucidesulfovibrio longus]
MRISCLLLWTCLAALALAACSTEADDMGIVARVNGKPIYLSQLEFQHDLLHMDGTGAFVPTVEVLRGEYGQILGDLIVMEMVSQELDARGLGVTDEEVAEEERKVRADYPDDSFDQVLVEEYIDLASWRERLRYNKALEKFQRLVLRPQIKIDYREAEDYYKQHIKDFRIPETLRILVVRSSDKAPLAEALKVYRDTRDPEAMRADEKVAVHEITVRQGQLSSSWLEALQELPPGESSPIMEEKFGYEALVLLERLPAKQLDPTQAYPLVEQALLEHKMRDAFETWLSNAWNSADVQVSEHLLPRPEGEAAAEAGDPAAQEDQANLESRMGQEDAGKNALQEGMAPLGPDDTPLEQEGDNSENAVPAEGQAQ